MGSLVWTNAKVTINGVDLSDHVKQVTLNFEAELQDETAMGQTTRINKPGLLAWDVEVQFFQDFAASKVDATLFPLVGAAAFAISVVPVNTTVAATNPNFNGNVVLEKYTPITAAVGDMAVVPVSFKSAGALARTT